MAQHYYRDEFQSEAPELAPGELAPPPSYRREVPLSQRVKDLTQAYQGFVSSQMNFIKVKAKEDGQVLLKKSLFLLLAVGLGFFAYIGFMAWIIERLAQVTGLGWSLFIVSAAHLLGAALLFFSSKKKEAFKTLPLSRLQGDELMRRLETDELKNEGREALAALQTSEQQAALAKAQLSYAIKDKLDVKRVMVRNPGPTLGTALLLGVAFALTKGRQT